MSNVIPIMQLPTTTTGLYEVQWRDYLKVKNYDPDINNMCSNCQKDQIDKFGKITIQCTGLKSLTDEVIDENPLIFDNLDDDELDLMKQIYDPYYWADKNIDIKQENLKKRMFKQRWYQESIVKCSSNRKVVRCGRRAGKTFSVALDVLHRMMTRSNYRVLMVAPFQTQAKELSDTIRKLIKVLNPDYGGWGNIVERSVTTPVHEIKFYNGSVFKAFTAGANGAGATRGQGADLIILDEADFLSQEAFNAILAILMDTPDTEMIVTSTPYGENVLYKLAQMPEYREFHFPSFVLPHYSDKLDKDLRDGSDVAGYIQEIQAEFGLDTTVVFQPEFINQSKNIVTNSDSDVFINRQDYILILGCDWNGDKVGTRICIVGLHKKTGAISIVKMDNVKKEGWTQVEAVNKIVSLNRMYDLDHIYVDEGFGESNVQQLKLVAINNYGRLPYDHPDLKLDSVVAVNFASTLELKDVVTGEIRKKYYKNFMVETVNRSLESGILALGDPQCVGIIAQMKNYIVKSTSANGRKIYTAKDEEIGDHDLDAYMMAIMGLHLEYESMLDKTVLSTVQILPFAKLDSTGYNSTNTVEKRLSSDELQTMTSQLFYSYKNNKPTKGRTSSLSSGRTMGLTHGRGGFSRSTSLYSRNK